MDFLVYILFAVGFFLLIKGADILIDGASSLARKFGVPPLVVGLTVVAFGTSAPELAVSIIGVLKGSSDLVIGNIVGSNIANILLILGVTATITPIAMKHQVVWKDIPFTLLSALAFLFLANDWIFGKSPNMISLTDGVLLLVFFSLFLYYTFSVAKKKKNEEEKLFPKHKPLKALLYILLGLLGLVVGGKWIVDGAIAIATGFGVSESIIGLTIVAVGTSLPELATSIVSAFKKETDIAVGNIIGSNIFNTFLILGVSSVVAPLPFSVSSNSDLILMTGSTMILFLLLFAGKKWVIERWQGAGLVVVYIAYILSFVLRA